LPSSPTLALDTDSKDVDNFCIIGGDGLPIRYVVFPSLSTGSPPLQSFMQMFFKIGLIFLIKNADTLRQCRFLLRCNNLRKGR
jgi:hypothetical protein